MPNNSCFNGFDISVLTLAILNNSMISAKMEKLILMMQRPERLSESFAGNQQGK